MRSRKANFFHKYCGNIAKKLRNIDSINCATLYTSMAPILPNVLKTVDKQLVLLANFHQKPSSIPHRNIAKFNLLIDRLFTLSTAPTIKITKLI